MSDDLLILCYHAVSPTWPADLSVTPERLDQHLRLLTGRGYRACTLSEAFAPGASGRRLVVTFDDAFRSVLTEGKPVLDALGVPATLFVPTGKIGNGEPLLWPGIDHWQAGPYEHELTGMTWDEVAAVSAGGWEIGAHTVSHPRLTTLDSAAVDRELSDSKAELERRLGLPCATLAYPYGDVNGRVEASAGKAGYELAVGLSSSLDRNPEHLNWPRVGIYQVDDLRRFRLKVSPLSRRMRSTRLWAGTVKQRRSRSAEEQLSVSRPQLAQRTAHDTRVAVIVPCYNDGATVRETIASIDEPEPVEVVIIDDGSPDPATREVLADLEREGTRVIRHDQNRGLPAARNTGLAATSAPFVFPLDSDDMAVAGALTTMADRLERSPGAAAAYGDWLEFGPHEKARSAPDRFDPYVVAFRNRYPVESMFRRTVLEAVGGWTQVGDLVGYEDWNLWMSLAERHEEVVYVGPGLLCVRYRIHGDRMFRQATRTHGELYATLRELHPALFAELPALRRRSSLNPVMRLAYPYLFGGRAPRGIWSRAERAIDWMFKRGASPQQR